MNIRDYNTANGNSLDPIVLYASEYLEHHGMCFLMNFGLDNAVNKAAKMFTEFLDEDWFDENYNGWT